MELPTPATAGKRLILVFAGLVLIQCLLLGSCLVGEKLQLPVDLVDFDSPQTELVSSYVFGDSITQREPARVLSVRAIRDGRIPFWDPHSFCGVPFADFGKYSPYLVPRYLFNSPVMIAWAELLKAIVLGMGTYWFLRHSLRLRFWPATFAAWCAPELGFFVFWQADPISDAATWFPLLLVMVDSTIRRPRGLGVIGLSLVTAASLLSGHVDITGQVLLGSGFYSLFRLVRRYGIVPTRNHLLPVLALIVGWLAGFGLAAPYVVPLVKYLPMSYRLKLRSEGDEERPPGDWRVLPQIAFAEWYGSHRMPDTYAAPGSGNLNESAGTAYAGVIALFAAAPFAANDRRRRGVLLFFLILGLFGGSWVTGNSLLIPLLRLPGLNFLSHNRMTFLTAFSILTLAASGLNALMTRRGRFQLPHALSGCCALILLVLAIQKTVHHYENVPQLARLLATCAVLGFIATKLLLVSCVRPRMGIIIGVAMVVEMIHFAYGYQPRGEPDRYYPRVELFDSLRGTQDRTLGLYRLDVDLHWIYGIREIRGYDALDPAPMVELLETVRAENSSISRYARLRRYIPKGDPLHPPPLLSMLDVRYFVVASSGGQRVVVENPHAVGRVYVPRRVETLTDSDERLRRLSSWDFDPKDVAYLEEPVTLPGECKGRVELTEEEPCRLEVKATMETAGLLVLTDSWFEGWTARVDGVETPILRTNHALRGIPLTAGNHEIVYEYEPPGFQLGLVLAGISILLLLASRISGVGTFHSTKS